MIKFIEYHDESLDWTHPIMKYLRPDIADHVREVRGLAKVDGIDEAQCFQLKYNSKKFRKTEIREKIIRQLTQGR